MTLPSTELEIISVLFSSAAKDTPADNRTAKIMKNKKYLFNLI